jgi:hypothetical protein
MAPFTKRYRRSPGVTAKSPTGARTPSTRRTAKLVGRHRLVVTEVQSIDNMTAPAKGTAEKKSWTLQRGRSSMSCAPKRKKAGCLESCWTRRHRSSQRNTRPSPALSMLVDMSRLSGRIAA